MNEAYISEYKFRYGSPDAVKAVGKKAPFQYLKLCYMALTYKTGL